MKVLLCDLQFSKHGSFIDDFNSIKRILDSDHEIVYYTDTIQSILSIDNVIKFVVFCKKNKYEKIVILSSKLTIIPFLMMFIKNVCFVYHFTPNKRQNIHKHLLNFIAKRNRIGLYSYGIYTKMKNEKIKNIFYLPSRIIDLEKIRVNYIKKINSNSVNIFIPFIKLGVRKWFDFNKIFEQISQYYKIENIYIQNIEIFDEISKIYNVKQLNNYMKIDDYNQIYNSSTFVLLEFDDLYELRASGIILDSIASASIVITSDHEINFQYGFPDFPIMSIDSIKELKLLNEELIQQKLIKTNLIFENEFKNSWENFIK
jgi:hypothetical protein